VHAEDEDRHVPAGDRRAMADDAAGTTHDDVVTGATTGDVGVDEALGRLGELDGLPVRDHVPVYAAIHAALQDRLADVED